MRRSGRRPARTRTDLLYQKVHIYQKVHRVVARHSVPALKNLKKRHHSPISYRRVANLAPHPCCISSTIAVWT
jgi:hypothetical protein